MWVAMASLGVTSLIVVLWERQFSASMDGIRLLDTYPWLPPVEKYARIEAIGSAGRLAQKWFWAFGSVHSFVEYSAAALAAVGLGKGLGLEGRHWRLLVVAAIAGLFVELVENLALLVVLTGFPRRLPEVAWASTGITLTKFAIKLSLWGVLATLFAVWLIRQGRRGWSSDRAA
jgi:hypothetical protein